MKTKIVKLAVTRVTKFEKKLLGALKSPEIKKEQLRLLTKDTESYLAKLMELSKEEMKWVAQLPRERIKAAITPLQLLFEIENAKTHETSFLARSFGIFSILVLGIIKLELPTTQKDDFLCNHHLGYFRQLMSIYRFLVSSLAECRASSGIPDLDPGEITALLGDQTPTDTGDDAESTDDCSDIEEALDGILGEIEDAIEGININCTEGWLSW